MYDFKNCHGGDTPLGKQREGKGNPRSATPRTKSWLRLCSTVGRGARLADSSDFGLLGKQSSQKYEIPCLGRRRTAEQNVTPLALSSAEKSVTVQTHTKKQTVNDISTICLSACVDKTTSDTLNIVSPAFKIIFVCRSLLWWLTATRQPPAF